jgi:hypothetical protein
MSCKALMTTAIVIAAIGTGARASADPTTDRVFTAPTAWLAPEHAIVATGAADLRAIAEGRFESMVVVGYGLGGIAQLDFGTDADVRGCDGCRAAGALPLPLYLARGSFRMGVRQDTWFRGMPALALGTRVSFLASGPFDGLKVVDLYAVASRVLFAKTRTPLRLHAGLQIIDAGFETEAGRVDIRPRFRPTAGLEWTPPQYPRTSLMGDLAYVPLIASEPTPRVNLEWVAGWGVRYQAFDWGAIELAVRHREDEGIGDSTVFVRLTGVRRLSR